jgi:hypothetical protein
MRAPTVIEARKPVRWSLETRAFLHRSARCSVPSLKLLYPVTARYRSHDASRLGQELEHPDRTYRPLRSRFEEDKWSNR